jgi:hypothetical protein
VVSKAILSAASVDRDFMGMTSYMFIAGRNMSAALYVTGEGDNPSIM